MDLLADPIVIEALKRAWNDSRPRESKSRHEEGGFIVQDAVGSVAVIRWPAGEQFRIVPPRLDTKGCYNGLIVIAAFHTHPNPPVDEEGDRWEQSPSGSDRRWHERHNIPGIVMSRDAVYEVHADHSVTVRGTREEVLGT